MKDVPGEVNNMCNGPQVRQSRYEQENKGVPSCFHTNCVVVSSGRWVQRKRWEAEDEEAKCHYSNTVSSHSTLPAPENFHWLGLGPHKLLFSFLLIHEDNLLARQGHWKGNVSYWVTDLLILPIDCIDKACHVSQPIGPLLRGAGHSSLTDTNITQLHPGRGQGPLISLPINCLLKCRQFRVLCPGIVFPHRYPSAKRVLSPVTAICSFIIFHDLLRIMASLKNNWCLWHKPVNVLVVCI